MTAGPPTLVTIATGAAGQRLVDQQVRDIQHLVERVGSNDTRLMEQRVHRHVGG